MLPDKIEIIQKDRLTQEQIRYLRERVSADEHRMDPGPCGYLDTTPSSFYFIVCDANSKKPIGILYRGGTKEATIVSWWLDQKYRGHGVGNEMIDLFVTKLKQEGVTGIGQLVIEPYHGTHNIASEKLALRLKVAFAT
jgi:RimJ/RimL family protein N-acetyltransferase